jgi:hypothetical protein
MTPALLVVSSWPGFVAAIHMFVPGKVSTEMPGTKAGYDVLEPSSANDAFRFEFQTATQYQIGLRDVASCFETVSQELRPSP